MNNTQETIMTILSWITKIILVSLIVLFSPLICALLSTIFACCGFIIGVVVIALLVAITLDGRDSVQEHLDSIRDNLKVDIKAKDKDTVITEDFNKVN